MYTKANNPTKEQERRARSLGHYYANYPCTSPTGGSAYMPSDSYTVALLGTHLPRQCGIATFTGDLSEAICSEFPNIECLVLAMNEAGRNHIYPERVRFEVTAADLDSYRRGADFLNASPVDVVSLQHEYGIFGGNAGGHILALLRELRMPVVTTLHTILAEPSPQQRLIMDELTLLSERLVVMSVHGAMLLREVHRVPAEKIDIIPHGIPDVPLSSHSKHVLKLEGKLVILTFGLLSPDKGIEYVIEAMPTILEQHPNTVYIVLGATHPQVKDTQGETYRLMLEQMARTLGVDAHIIFHNRFVNKEELSEFVAAADIYVTPYLKPEQITSGTLAYAIGAGKAVISTPYAYARELLADGRGILVPWRDSGAIAREVIRLLTDKERSQNLRQHAADYGNGMRWTQVARSYVQSFNRASAQHTDRLPTIFKAESFGARPVELPEFNIDHLRLLSDHTGILQHAVFNIPRYEDGYCLDDNARALLLTMYIEDCGMKDIRVVRQLSSHYLAFVNYAFDTRNGQFRNFMSYARQWIKTEDSVDCHGRALWALGAVARRSNNDGQRALAGSLFLKALQETASFTSPRGWAYALLGIDEFLRAFPMNEVVQCAGRHLSTLLLSLYERTRTPAWPWFETCASYCNARLPQALITAGAWLEEKRMVNAGIESLSWLVSVQRSEHGYFAPIGSDGFFDRGGSKASFDQQPVEACAMVSACLAANEATGKSQWAKEALCAFNWFLGDNQLQRTLYDPTTGGCRDGLHAGSANENQGAESTLSFLLALAEMRSAATRIVQRQRVPTAVAQLLPA